MSSFKDNPKYDPFNIMGSNSSSSANSASVLSDRAWSEAQAQKQMDFQERMSNTSWQRAVEDMQKAGLNPALAYMQGGASSATGAQASTSSTEQKQSQFDEKMSLEKFKFFVNSVLKMID